MSPSVVRETTTPVIIEPWPSERPLFVVNLVVGLAIWASTFVNPVSLGYTLAIFLVVVALQLRFFAHLKGSAVKVSEYQLPEIHDAVTRLAGRFGMAAPETYVMHGGGALNAFATRFVGGNIVILNAELLEACDGNTAARDMIIGHELGHLHRRHLHWHILIAPVALIPFIGTALSRAREYTCDRYGLAAAGDRQAAVLGLTLLAAGGRLGRRVDAVRFAEQRGQLDGGLLLKMGEWLSTHPPLSRRLVQLDGTLAGDQVPVRRGAWRAAAVLTMILLPVMLTGIVAAVTGRPLFSRAARAAGAPQMDSQAKHRQALYDIERLAEFAHAEARAGRDLPWDDDELYSRWMAAHPGEPEPLDPYDGFRYVYELKGTRFRLWSYGFDERHPDLQYDSGRAASRDTHGGIDNRPVSQR